MFACLAASMTSSMVTSRLLSPYMMFSAMVRSNKVGSCREKKKIKMDNFTEYSHSEVEPKSVFFSFFIYQHSICDFCNQGSKCPCLFVRNDPVILGFLSGSYVTLLGCI
jgi:hypothetical protein